MKRLKQLAEATGESLHAILALPSAPVDLEGAAALTTLVRLLGHRFVHADGEQFAKVRAVDLCLAGDGARLDSLTCTGTVLGEGVRRLSADLFDPLGVVENCSNTAWIW